MSRDKHEFQFTATKIAEAALAEGSWHLGRIGYWREEYKAARAKVEATMGCKIVEMPVTGLAERINVVVDYGDVAAYRRLGEADVAIRRHQEAADRYLSDSRLYNSQGERSYELSANDVGYFRLDGAPREDV